MPYNKTTWTGGDTITVQKLNKIENQLENINGSISSLVNYQIENGAIAEAFDNTKSYSTGDYVIRNGQLHRFLSDYIAGSVNVNTIKVSVGEELNDFKSDINEKYTLPSGGMPLTDMSSAVRTSLGKADTALQTAPVASVDGKTGSVTVLPSGGTQGQVLKKSSSSNYAVEWGDQAAASAVLSVNGKTGTVSLNASDVGALPSNTSIPVIDNTLSQTGRAADAKAVGDKIGNLASLTTVAKNNLVAAINQVAYTGSPNDLFYVSITIDDGVINIIDRTYADIVEAKNAGKLVCANVNGEQYQFGWHDTQEEIVWFTYVGSLQNDQSITDCRVGISSENQGYIVNFSTPKIDTTLSHTGDAADAKAVGDIIGNLSNLATSAKNNLVAAINEASISGGSSSNSLYKVAIWTDDGVVTLVNHSYQDIISAKNDSKFVYAVVNDDLICPLAGVDTEDQVAWFSSIDSSLNNQQVFVKTAIGIGSQSNIISTASTLNIDTTLTQSGKAADAKIVGDKIGNLSNLTTSVKSDLVSAINAVSTVPYLWTGKCSTAASSVTKSVTLRNSDNFSFTAGATIAVYFTYGNTVSKPTLTVQGVNYPVYISTDASSQIQAASSSIFYSWGKGLHFFTYSSSRWILNSPDFVSIYQLTSTLNNKASTVSPSFTGNPTAPTQAVGNNSNRIATTAFVQTAAENKVADKLINNTSEGAIASFNDGADNVLINDLMVNIEPVQNGSGDPSPSNIRSISGWNEANIVRCGKNFINSKAVQSQTINGVTFTVNSDGSVTANGTATENAIFYLYDSNNNGLDINTLKHLNGKTVTISSGLGANENVYIYGWHIKGTNSVSTVSADSVTFTFAIGTGANITLQIKSGYTANNVVFKPQLELGSTATAYEPYDSNTYTISFGAASPVYGGTLDVTTGELTVDKLYRELSSSIQWTKSSSYSGGFYTAAYNLAVDGHNPKTFTPFICSHAKSVTEVAQYANGTCYMDNSVNIRIMTADTTVEQWGEYLDAQATANTPVSCCFELDSPFTYQFTPQEIKTLLGNNNIYADTGNSTVDYKADTKLYIANNHTITSVDGKTGAVTILPTGGTQGQVLKKLSSSNYDVAWANETTGGGGSNDNLFCVNVLMDDGEIASVDKTYSQIVAAYSAGKYVYALVDGTHYDFGWIDTEDECAMFRLISFGNPYYSPGKIFEDQICVGSSSTIARFYQTDSIDDIIVSEFSTGTTYYAGQYCKRNGNLYRFTSNHTGAWSNNHVTQITVSSELSNLRWDVGDLTNLSTLSNSNLVAAINEVAAGGSKPVQKIWTGTCSTIAATAQKVITLDDDTGFSLTAGNTIAVYFSNGNNALAPTLKVGAAEAKNVRFAVGSVQRTQQVNGQIHYMWGRGIHFFTYVDNGWLISSADSAIIDYIAAQLPRQINNFDDGAVSATLTAGYTYLFFGNLTSLDISLGSGFGSHYYFAFTCGATAPTVTLPIWVTLPAGQTFEANTRYEVDILSGYGVVMAWPINSSS